LNIQRTPFCPSGLGFYVHGNASIAFSMHGHPIPLLLRVPPVITSVGLSIRPHFPHIHGPYRPMTETPLPMPISPTFPQFPGLVGAASGNLPAGQHGVNDLFYAPFWHSMSARNAERPWELKRRQCRQVSVVPLFLRSHDFHKAGSGKRIRPRWQSRSDAVSVDLLPRQLADGRLRVADGSREVPTPAGTWKRRQG